MKNKSIFIIIIFVLFSTISFSDTNKISLENGSIPLKLEYSMSIEDSEAVIVFYIPNILTYHRWNKYSKLKFDKQVFNLILKNSLYSTDKNIDILVRPTFFPLKNKIIYSKRYNFEHQKNLK